MTLLQRLYAQRTAILDQIDAAMDTAGISNYSVSDSDGSQSLSRRSLTDLYNSLDVLESRIDKEERRGQGGLTILRTRLFP
jgi:hypothetical protein